MKNYAIVAVLACLGTLAAVRGLGWAPLPAQVKLENARVKVSSLTYEPGVPRERHVRASDQVIVFLDDCKYERTDPVTGKKEIRERKSGDTIWHSKGEDAPVLVNAGDKTYRTLLIELK